MNYRLFQEMANAHITELEQDAHSARLARRRGVHVNFRLSTLPGLALRFVAQLRRRPGSHALKPRVSTDLSLVPPSREFAPVADRSNPACEVVGAANHAAGSPGLWSTRDDVSPQKSLAEDEFASTERRRDMDSCRTCAS